ncbi:MAG: RNA degradosome polyphosphate kinase [Lachnospiraceae bacterium]|nr:RNA degradosome polyphosphate kinase [Lachnospiraceae bacterium]
MKKEKDNLAKKGKEKAEKKASKLVLEKQEKETVEKKDVSEKPEKKEKESAEKGGKKQPKEKYENRELSWLKFNERVLGEARDKQKNPLLERCKFLSITASNLDEFFMVRIASLKDMQDAGYHGRDIAGMTPEEQLKSLSEETHKFIRGQYRTLKRSLLPKLSQNRIKVLLSHEEMDGEQAAFADACFESAVFPVLTPMAVDSSRPFPLIKNKGVYLGVLLKEHKSMAKSGKKKKRPDIAIVPVPSGLPRLMELPVKNGGEEKVSDYILLEEIIKRNIGKLFAGCEVECAYCFRLIRNADLSIDEDEAEDLLIEIEKKLKRRQWGQVIRLDVEAGMDIRLKDFLSQALFVSPMGIYEIDGPLDLTFLMQLYASSDREDLKNPPFEPAHVFAPRDGEDLFERIRKKDILLFHPYESFDPVVDFIRWSAKDPGVLAIKQTLYRVSGHSPIVEALAQAALAGKQVTVLVELKARFDEEHNIEWARKLEQAGCNVIYGLVGLKTHCKITMVVRKEGSQILRYVHLGTGNYNDSTAKLYTDMGLFTVREEIGEDATDLFNMLSGYSEPKQLRELCAAPLWLKDRFIELINREKENAKQGKPAGIVAKMNSLCDKEVIDALYAASKTGVKIELIIRGICCLRAGLPDISENITVRSIVGTFLEHARIFKFENGGEPEYYLGSADWMPRNLERRVELLFPILDQYNQKKVEHILELQLKDTMRARFLRPDGTYKKPDLRSEEKRDSQEEALEEAREAQQAGQKEQAVFIPKTSSHDYGKI